MKLADLLSRYARAGTPEHPKWVTEGSGTDGLASLQDFPSLSPDDREAFEERVAIMEVDGGLSHDVAVREAAQHMEINVTLEDDNGNTEAN